MKAVANNYRKAKILSSISQAKNIMQWTLGLLTSGWVALMLFLNLDKNIAVLRRSNALGVLPYHYQLSNSERAFLSVLEKAVGSNFYVIGKVKAFEVLQLEKATALTSKMILKNFDAYYFDYVVCAINSQAIACVVELEKVASSGRDNRSYSRLNEELMQGFCQRSLLPRLIVSEQRGYDLNELIERFEAVTDNVEIAEVTTQSFV